MSFDQALKDLTPEMIAEFKKAIEIGKWPDGRVMSEEQKALCLEAVLKYEIAHNLPEEDRLGYIDRSGLEKKRKPGAKPTHVIKLMNGES